REPDSVSQATRLRVQEAMSEIGYLPHLSARSLVSQRSNIVATVIPAIDNPAFAETTGALAAGLSARGIQVMIGYTDFRIETEEAVTSALLARRPDGLVLIGSSHSERLRRLARTSGVPIVETWELPETPIDMVAGFDNFAAIAALTASLVAKGYRRFAYLTGDHRRLLRLRQRLAGLRHVLQASGLALDDGNLFERSASYDNGAEVIRELLRRKSGVDVLVCSGDVYAIGAILECARLGVRVPGDMAIAGFGGFDLGHLLTPELTTVQVRGREIGAAAAKLLLDRFDGRRARGKVVDVGFSLVPGKSA
ncbi:MAG: LacI family DNA-binding transcriptional regulator, partial [Tagaea sp.]|nr:LacI family DNA-binding transcriptional regulator [Tagaea sp.]